MITKIVIPKLLELKSELPKTFILTLSVFDIPDEFIQYSIPLHEPIISKLKIESWQMNPNVSDIPQEAKVSIITKTYKEANLYAKIVPTTEWEELVIHIVRKSNNIPNPSLW